MVDMSNGLPMIQIQAKSDDSYAPGVETICNYKRERTLWGDDGAKVAGADTAREAMKAAGLDWFVSKVPLIYQAYERGEQTPEGETLFSGAYANVDHYAMMRSTDRKCLGVVGGRYEPVQNSEAFCFVDSLVEEGHLRYEIAGALNGGSRVWVQAEVTESAYEVVPGDEVKNYVLLYNTHNGSGALKALFTDIRVWCSNTANAAIKGRSGVSLRHTPSVHDKLAEAAEVMGFVSDNLRIRRLENKKLASRQMNSTQLEAFAAHIAPIRFEGTDKATARGITRAENVRGHIVRLFEEGRGNHLAGVRGTNWAAYNAVTEYINYVKPVKGEKVNGNGSAKRMESALLGSGSHLIDTARNYLLAA